MAGEVPPRTNGPQPALELRGSVDEGKLEASLAPSHPPTSAPLEKIEAATTALEGAFDVSSISTVIATVPDPVDSGLVYSFETMLQALRRGIEDAPASAIGGSGSWLEAHHRARSFLPWDDRDGDAAQQRDSEQCRISLPGLMLFRGDTPEKPSLVAMLLVGESPTAGLRQAAMLNALDIQQIFGGQEQLPTIRIVGPSFSGSAQSMNTALHNWARRAENRNLQIEYQVVSGSATGSKVPVWLGRAHAPVNGALAVDHALTPNSRISYEATTLPEKSLECAYFHFLNRQLDVEPETFSAQGETAKSLEGVVTLSESGTEFGTTTDTSAITDCPFQAAAKLHFPFHVSALRDAYDELDHKDARTKQDTPIARALSLDASLRETRFPLDVEANPSPKTRTADDIELGNVLDYVSTRHIRHVAIHATEIGDAIFLARRVRDIAPDVRLAFFGSDTLLLHPEFRRELLGSLVITPYPFLGSHDFDDEGRNNDIDGFENSDVQGVYNAVLAERGVDRNLLSNYAVGSTSPLPVWISTLGRGVFVPTKMAPSADCDQVLQGHSETPDETRDVRCTDGQAKTDEDKRDSNWQAFAQAHTKLLQLDRRERLPYAWNLLFTLIFVAGLIDWSRQKDGARLLDTTSFPTALALTPKQDHELDLAIGRTKWRLYAVIRTYLFCVAFSYMGAVYLLAAISGGWFVHSLRPLPRAYSCFCALVIALAICGSLFCTCLAVKRFWGDFAAFGRCVRRKKSEGPPQTETTTATTVDSSPSLSLLPPPLTAIKTTTRRSLGAASLALGFLPPKGREETARVSFGQLRLLVLLSFALSLVFAGFHVADTLLSAGLWSDFRGGEGSLSRTLFVLREAKLTSGVAPSAPAVLCMAAVYIWAVGRMRRLALAHSLSRLSPDDGEVDLVSTPISVVLHPESRSSAEKSSAAGFIAAERKLLNAIWRPITGGLYVGSAATLAAFPAVVFTLKPLATLTGLSGTLFLGGGLALCVYLVGVTLAQLHQYWASLEALLKRTMEHPVGAALRCIPSFARDSVDHQISRTPDTRLRWSASAQQFCELMRSSESSLGSLDESELEEEVAKKRRELEDSKLELEGSARKLEALRLAALSNSTDEANAAAEYELAKQAIQTAAQTTALLRIWWQSKASAAKEPVVARHTENLEVSIRPAVGSDLTTTTSSGYVTQQLEGHTIKVTSSSVPPPPSSGVHEAAPSSAELANPGRQADLADALSPLGSSLPASQLKWLRDAQTFVATVVTLLIHQHVRQFRYFLHVTTGCALLLVLAVASYPFEPYRLLLTFIWIVMAAVVGSCLWIFMQMDRNTVMSHISGTSPQALTVDGAFVLRVLAWTVVPLLSVAAAQYPEVASVLYRAVSPFADALR